MPRRSRGQRTGDAAEDLVLSQIDNHPAWLARAQDKDFGIDVEAELAVASEEGQELVGRLIKVQVKGSESFVVAGGVVSTSLDRDYLDYVALIKLPVILVAVDTKGGIARWIWLQAWMLQNEARLAESSSKSLTIHIPAAATLASGLDGALQEIARGEPPIATVLALRELITVASATNNQALYEGALDLLNKLDAGARPWAVQKIIDALIGFGSNPGPWQTHRVIPHIVALVERVGPALTADQLLRLVGREDTYSRAGLIALSVLYDRFPEYARSLGLPTLFHSREIHGVGWYCELREHYPEMSSTALWGALGQGRLPCTRFSEFEIAPGEAAKDFIASKWPTRGDSVFVDCLHWTGQMSDE